MRKVEAMETPEVAPAELACEACGRTTYWCNCHAPATFAEGDIAAFARQIEIAAGDQQALWHEGI